MGWCDRGTGGLETRSERDKKEGGGYLRLQGTPTRDRGVECPIEEVGGGGGTKNQMELRLVWGEDGILEV